MQTEQLLCWSGMTDTEHSTTSGSNELVVLYIMLFVITFVEHGDLWAFLCKGLIGTLDKFIYDLSGIGSPRNSSASLRVAPPPCFKLFNATRFSRWWVFPILKVYLHRTRPRLDAAFAKEWSKSNKLKSFIQSAKANAEHDFSLFYLNHRRKPRSRSRSV